MTHSARAGNDVSPRTTKKVQSDSSPAFYSELNQVRDQRAQARAGQPGQGGTAPESSLRESNATPTRSSQSQPTEKSRDLDNLVKAYPKDPTSRKTWIEEIDKRHFGSAEKLNKVDRVLVIHHPYSGKGKEPVTRVGFDAKGETVLRPDAFGAVPKLIKMNGQWREKSKDGQWVAARSQQHDFDPKTVEQFGQNRPDNAAPTNPDRSRRGLAPTNGGDQASREPKVEAKEKAAGNATPAIDAAGKEAKSNPRLDLDNLIKSNPDKVSRTTVSEAEYKSGIRESIIVQYPEGPFKIGLNANGEAIRMDILDKQLFNRGQISVTKANDHYLNSLIKHENKWKQFCTTDRQWHELSGQQIGFSARTGAFTSQDRPDRASVYNLGGPRSSIPVGRDFQVNKPSPQPAANEKVQPVNGRGAQAAANEKVQPVNGRGAQAAANEKVQPINRRDLEAAVREKVQQALARGQNPEQPKKADKPEETNMWQRGAAEAGKPQIRSITLPDGSKATATVQLDKTGQPNDVKIEKDGKLIAGFRRESSNGEENIFETKADGQEIKWLRQRDGGYVSYKKQDDQWVTNDARQRAIYGLKFDERGVKSWMDEDKSAHTQFLDKTERIRFADNHYLNKDANGNTVETGFNDKAYLNYKYVNDGKTIEVYRPVAGHLPEKIAEAKAEDLPIRSDGAFEHKDDRGNKLVENADGTTSRYRKEDGLLDEMRMPGGGRMTITYGKPPMPTSPERIVYTAPVRAANQIDGTLTRTFEKIKGDDKDRADGSPTAPPSYRETASISYPRPLGRPHTVLLTSNPPPEVFALHLDQANGNVKATFNGSRLLCRPRDSNRTGKEAFTTVTPQERYLQALTEFRKAYRDIEAPLLDELRLNGEHFNANQQNEIFLRYAYGQAQNLYPENFPREQQNPVYVLDAANSQKFHDIAKRNKAGAAWMLEIATESIRHDRARGRGPIVAMRERE